MSDQSAGQDRDRPTPDVTIDGEQKRSHDEIKGAEDRQFIGGQSQRREDVSDTAAGQEGPTPAQHGTPPDGWQGTFPTHTARLAECYRLTGADPDGAPDAILALEALDEVRRFRKSYDELEEAIAAVGESLDWFDAPQGATYAERIDRLYRELRSGEDHFRAQRDSALRLVRWLVGDLIDTRFATDDPPPRA